MASEKTGQLYRIGTGLNQAGYNTWNQTHFNRAGKGAFEIDINITEKNGSASNTR